MFVVLVLLFVICIACFSNMYKRLSFDMIVYHCCEAVFQQVCVCDNQP